MNHTQGVENELHEQFSRQFAALFHDPQPVRLEMNKASALLLLLHLQVALHQRDNLAPQWIQELLQELTRQVVEPGSALEKVYEQVKVRSYGEPQTAARGIKKLPL